MIPMNLQLLHDQRSLSLNATAEGRGSEQLIQCLSKFDTKFFTNEFKPNAKFTIKFTFKGDFTCVGYGWRAANDCPERDPGDWQLWAMVNGNLEDIDEVTGAESVERGDD